MHSKMYSNIQWHRISSTRDSYDYNFDYSYMKPDKNKHHTREDLADDDEYEVDTGNKNKKKNASKVDGMEPHSDLHNWEERIDAIGEKYWRHLITREVVWEEPKKLQEKKQKSHHYSYLEDPSLLKQGSRKTGDGEDGELIIPNNLSGWYDSMSRQDMRDFKNVYMSVLKNARSRSTGTPVAKWRFA